MPIPDFIDNYHLPPGEHECTLDEIENRFLTTPERERVWGLFKGLLNRLETLGLQPDIILINGSFVTGRQHPGDVDFAGLIPPANVAAALANLTDEHDRRAIFMLSDPRNQTAIRDVFGAHFLIAGDIRGLNGWSILFRKGMHGSLRDPDPVRDPDWVTKPAEKGILKVRL